ncbi:four-carbon acid sugar kinase family protein [Silvibacterium dinghuense]|uniref:Four-carbon acid sugar kinase family protein n=1 Tax=Silvibacterium dinghuense TaxID=1560006 RepID=A0A4Q1SCG1_9BACT|nr:four-carbon acid sugar kinase family protein [Silvibacterium dinghuense]RXS94916.1 hypothetical protein ESZ00_09755 [Silvibacterium dinghuense]
MAIVADDLTGACDAAVAFTGLGQTVRVYLDAVPKAAEGVYAVSTESRSLTEHEAVARLARLAWELPRMAQIFKKIDSVFRGNSFAEIAAAVRTFPERLAVLAPSYPAHGRRVRNGMLHGSGLENDRPLDLAAALCAAVCAPLVMVSGEDAETQMQAAPYGALLLCDAWDQDELEAVVRAAATLRERVLWIGSGGLAHALAAAYGVTVSCDSVRWPRGRTIFVVGSDHIATQQQVLHLEESAVVQRSGCGEKIRTKTSSFVLDVPRGTGVESVRAALMDIRPEDTACLFLTGGDTAMLVCRALGIRSLRLLREFAPGVPMGIAEGGAFDGVRVMLKSGGFGERDLLQRVYESFHDKESVTV